MPHIPKAFCRTCAVEMVIDHTGMLIECVASWGSYYKIYVDAYVCPRNSDHTAMIPGQQPVAMHYEDTYEQYHAKMKVEFADN